MICSLDCRIWATPHIFVGFDGLAIVSLTCPALKYGRSHPSGYTLDVQLYGLTKRISCITI
jgi:hypothetical protein